MNTKQLEFNFDDKPEPNKIIDFYQAYYPTSTTDNTANNNYFRITSYAATVTFGSATVRYI